MVGFVLGCAHDFDAYQICTVLNLVLPVSATGTAKTFSSTERPAIQSMSTSTVSLTRYVSPCAFWSHPC